jgi:hypothetical protein
MNASQAAMTSQRLLIAKRAILSTVVVLSAQARCAGYLVIEMSTVQRSLPNARLSPRRKRSYRVDDGLRSKELIWTSPGKMIPPEPSGNAGDHLRHLRACIGA